MKFDKSGTNYLDYFLSNIVPKPIEYPICSAFHKKGFIFDHITSIWKRGDFYVLLCVPASEAIFSRCIKEVTAVNNFHFFLFICTLKDHFLFFPTCRDGCVIQKGSKSLDPVPEKVVLRRRGWEGYPGWDFEL